MIRPFSPVLGCRARGLLVMVAEMNRIENAARLAMGDHGSELVVKSVGSRRLDHHEDRLPDRHGGGDRTDRGEPVLTRRSRRRPPQARQTDAPNRNLRNCLALQLVIWREDLAMEHIAALAVDHRLFRRPVGNAASFPLRSRCTKPPKIAIASCLLRSALSPDNMASCSHDACRLTRRWRKRMPN